ncbi:MAG: DUF3037 domain-containing protein [Chitinophagaceae bacterium]
MQEKHLYEYAIVRVVPRVERDEFINVGVVLYCQKLKFLKMRYQLVPERLHAFPVHPAIAELEPYLLAFQKICSGLPDAGPIATLDAGSRFRWLTAQRSTIVQTSRVHPGLTENPEMELDRLFQLLVS